jgi:hypothetical protein
VIVYKITIKDSVEERILDLQEKKRELANQTIEGGKGGAGKLGMKEILQLFHRNAENAPQEGGTESYDLGKQPRILKDVSQVSGEGSAVISSGVSAPRERTASPPANIASGVKLAPKVDPLYGRRW